MLHRKMIWIFITLVIGIICLFSSVDQLSPFVVVRNMTLALGYGIAQILFTPATLWVLGGLVLLLSPEAVERMLTVISRHIKSLPGTAFREHKAQPPVEIEDVAISRLRGHVFHGSATDGEQVKFFMQLLARNRPSAISRFYLWQIAKPHRPRHFTLEDLVL